MKHEGELIHALRCLTTAVNHQSILVRSSLQQEYTLDDLVARYRLGRDQILALMTEHLGYQGRPGLPARLHIDQVMRLDEIRRQMAQAPRLPAGAVR